MRTSFRPIVASVLALAVVVAGAAAQEVTTRPWGFGVAVGATVPVGDLGDFAGLGFHVKGSVHWERATMPIGFRGELEYADLGGKTVNIGTTALDGPDTRILSLGANVLWAFRQAEVVDADEGRSRGFPYAIAGIGVYDFDYSDSGIPGSGGGTTDFGLNAGAGWRFGIAGLRMNAEARFHYVFSDEPTNFIPFSLGIMF